MRLVCKNGHSLVEPPSRRVFYTVSVSACLFVGERLFQKVYGRPLPSTSPFTLFARSTEPQVVVLPLSHGSGRGENLVTIARFAKPLFANMHHHVHAVARALRKPNVAHGQCDGDVIDAEFALRRCHLSSTERIFFSFALFAKNVAIDLKCIENHGGKPCKLHSQQRAASGAPSEIVKESFALLRERTLGTWRWIFKL